MRRGRLRRSNKTVCPKEVESIGSKDPFASQHMSNPKSLPMHEAFTTTFPHYREALRPISSRLRTVTPHDDLPFYKYRSRFGKGLSALSLTEGRMGAL